MAIESVRNREIFAAVLAAVSTLLGVVLGAGLERWSQSSILEEMDRRDLVGTIAQRAQGRYFRARNLCQVTYSSKFSSRWDDYIENGVYPWNENLPWIETGIERHFPDSVQTLKDLEKEFGALNEALQVFHRREGRPSDRERTRVEQILERVEGKSKTLLEELSMAL